MPDETALAATPSPWSAWQRVDAACEAFEQAWRGGERPDLADHLAAAPEAMRGELLYHLLRIDLEYRRRQGDPCEPSTYLARFADHADTVRRAFGDDSTRSEFNTPAGTRPSLGPALSLPARRGKFELVELLGQGGMGIVYRAVEYQGDRPLRQVALKLIRPDLLASLSPERARELVARFQEEARLATQLEHDHIVRVYEVGTLDEQPYFSMQFVAGRNLADLLLEGPLTNARAAELMRGVALAVAAAHERGIIHRDLKPRNILLDARQRPYVADFGLARWLEEERELSQTEMPLGTAAYMSPEQATGRNVGKATDIYGLGATLYELLTDRPPFRAATAVETLVLVLHNDPVSPRELNPQIAADLQTICLKCLEKEPPARYSTATEVAEELGRFLEDRPIVARPASAVEIGWRWCRRNPWAAGLLAMILLVAVVSPVVAAVLYQQGVELSGVAGREKASAAREKGLRKDAETLARDLALRATLTDTTLGTYACAAGEPDRGLLNFARALDSCPQDERTLERTLRFSLAHWYERTHRKEFYIPLAGECLLAVDPRERFFFTALTDSIVLRSLEDGVPLAKPLDFSGLVREARFTRQGNCLLVLTTKGVQKPEISFKVDLPKPLPKGVQKLPISAKITTGPSEFMLHAFDLSDPRAPRFIRNLKFQRNLPRSLADAISPDETQIVLKSGSRAVQFYSLDDGQPRGAPISHPNSASVITLFLYDRSGKLLFTAATGDPVVRIWNVENGASDGEPLQLDGEAADFRLSPAGRWLITATTPRRLTHGAAAELGPSMPASLKVWDLATRKLVGEPFVGAFGGLRFTGDNSFVARRGDLPSHNRFSITHGANGSSKVVAEEFRGETYKAAVRADELRTSSLTLDFDSQQARIWQRGSTGIDDVVQVGQPLRHSEGIYRIAIAPISRKAFVSVGQIRAADDPAKYGVWCWKLAQPPPREQNRKALALSDTSMVYAKFNSDATLVAIPHPLNPPDIFEVPSGKPIKIGNSLGRHYRLPFFSPHEPHTLMLASENGIVRVDVARRQEFAHIPNPSLTGSLKSRPGVLPPENMLSPSFYSVAADHGHRLLATGYADGTVHLWDYDTGKRHGEPFIYPTDAPAFSRGILTVAFNRKGDKLLAVLGRTAMVWDAKTRQAWPNPVMHDLELVSATFSRDDRLVITAGKDKRVQMWDAENGGPYGQTIELPAVPQAIATSHDGSLLAVADGASINLYSTATGIPLATPLPCYGKVTALAFSGDGATIYAVAGQELAAFALVPPMPGTSAEIIAQFRKTLGVYLSDDGAIRNVK